MSVSRAELHLDNEQFCNLTRSNVDSCFCNMQTGKSISRASLRTQPPKRPAEGWSLVVRPAARGQDYEPFVATPDGSRRALSDDEAVYLKRMMPLPRRRIM